LVAWLVERSAERLAEQRVAKMAPPLVGTSAPMKVGMWAGRSDDRKVAWSGFRWAVVKAVRTVGGTEQLKAAMSELSLAAHLVAQLELGWAEWRAVRWVRL
jgi:hypothetical protein